MKATVQETANVSNLYRREWGNRCYELKITHRNKHEYFYIYVGQGGMNTTSPYQALRHLAREADTWERWDDFRDGLVYPDGLDGETAYLLYEHQKDQTDRLYKLLGPTSYEGFIEGYTN